MVKMAETKKLYIVFSKVFSNGFFALEKGEHGHLFLVFLGVVVVLTLFITTYQARKYADISL
jgi:hypothetical protein